MNAIAASLPELVGGSADLDPSTKTYLKGQGDFEPNNYAGRNIHNGVREHAMAAVNNGIAYHGGLLPFSATFFNFVDYLKPALRLTALAHIHHIYVFTHDPFFLVKTGRRTSRSNSSPCCARSQTSTQFVQPMRSRLWKLGSS